MRRNIPGILPHDLGQLFRYMFESSTVGRGQVILDRLAAAADSRNAFREAFENLIERLAEARAVELLRLFAEDPPDLEPVIRKERRSLPMPAVRPGDEDLEPFFRSRAESAAIRRALPNHRDRWSAYYRRYGCVRCGSKKKRHDSCGFCSSCRSLVTARLRGLRE